MFVLEIYNIPCSITHDKPDNGSWAQLNVITRIDKLLLDLMNRLNIPNQFNMYLTK